MNKSACLTVIKIWSWAPHECLTPRQSGRLAVGRNITLSLALTLLIASFLTDRKFKVLVQANFLRQEN
jgi:hypothetical protein